VVEILVETLDSLLVFLSTDVTEVIFAIASPRLRPISEDNNAGADVTAGSRQWGSVLEFLSRRARDSVAYSCRPRSDGQRSVQ